MQDDQKQRTNKLILTLALVTVGVMFCFSFLIAPFYNIICRATGISITTPDQLNQQSLISSPVDQSREIEVQFVAVNHDNLPWDFYPRQKSIKVHPGEKVKVVFFARNNTSREMTVQAIPSMTPPISVNHFHKMECFCFERQSMKAREGRDMALVFQIDRDLPQDIRTMTLAYTLFDVTQPVRKA